MELPKDPVMLLSVINTELRDKYPSLDALCEDREITKTSITDTLKGIDYEYDNIRNQFVWILHRIRNRKDNIIS